MRSVFSVSAFFMCFRECACGMSSYHLCGKSVVGCITDRACYRIICIRSLVDGGVTDRVRHRMQCEKSIVGTERIECVIVSSLREVGCRRETQGDAASYRLSAGYIYVYGHNFDPCDRRKKEILTPDRRFSFACFIIL